MDFSFGGIRIATDKELKVGEEFEMGFTLPNEQFFHLKGTVKYKDGKCYGIQFPPDQVESFLSRTGLSDYIFAVRADQDEWLRKKIAEHKATEDTEDTERNE